MYKRQVLDSTDCDDTNPTINPEATESVNYIDDNCDGWVANSERTYTDPTSGIELVFVKPGSFWMGDRTGTGDNDEVPPHKVTFSRGFYIGKYEVTDGQWIAVMGTSPTSGSCGLDCPVTDVTWTNCVEMAEALSTLSGRTFRLPSEAEWEYAATAGKNSLAYTYSGSDTASEVGWYRLNAGGVIHEVGLKNPNEFGLYDMSGTARDWVEDDFHTDYHGAPADGSAWIEDPRITPRMIRGGAYYNDKFVLRTRDRANLDPSGTDYGVSVRLVMDAN